MKGADGAPEKGEALPAANDPKVVPLDTENPPKPDVLDPPLPLLPDIPPPNNAGEPKEAVPKLDPGTV